MVRPQDGASFQLRLLGLLHQVVPEKCKVPAALRIVGLGCDVTKRISDGGDFWPNVFPEFFRKPTTDIYYCKSPNFAGQEILEAS